MRNQAEPSAVRSPVDRVVAALLWLFRFLFGLEFLAGLTVGLLLSIPVFTSALNSWADNGGVAQMCSQVETQK